MAEKWNEVEGVLDIWLPNVGDILTGTLKATREGTYGTQWLVVKDDKEEVWTPSHKVLQNRLNAVELGNRVKIERVEDLAPKTRGFNPTVMYKVFVSGV